MTDNVPTLPARKRNLFRRRNLIAVIAIVAVLASAAVVDRERPQDADQISGPYGPPPSSLAAAPPLRSARTAATLARDALHYRGIGIERGRLSDTVTAVNLRTGRLYWKYRRRGHEVLGTTLDPATGELFLLWTSVSSSGARRPLGDLAMVNVRIGRIRWDKVINEDLAPADPMVVATPGIAVVATKLGMIGIDRRTGVQRWHTSGGCIPADETSTATILVVQQLCGRHVELDGYDPLTGIRRWTRRTARWFPGLKKTWGPWAERVGIGDLDARKIVIWSGRLETVMDATTGHTVAEHKDSYGVFFGTPRALSSGIVYNTCTLATGETALCAHDPVKGKLRWHFRLPERSGIFPQHGSVAVADGRVYALADQCDEC